jgi:5'-nucleotidase/UDP-sugar diphosphatase
MKCFAKSPVLTAMSITAAVACGSKAHVGEPHDASGDRHLVLLFTADEHSHLFSSSPELDDYAPRTSAGSGALVGGIARRAAVLERERDAAAAAGKSSLTVSAGDNQMGALPHITFESASIDYQVMAALGYDATTLGNHEFDFGPAALAHAVTAAGASLPAIVASNLHFSDADSADDELAGHFSADAYDGAAIHPYRVITTATGIKVGLFGYVGINASHLAPNKAPITFSERELSADDASKPDAVLPHLYADLQPIVDELRNDEKVDVVIGLSHAGIADATHPETGEDYQVAMHVAGIDVIISGHAHNEDAKPIVVQNPAAHRDVVVLNASAYGKHVGRIDLTVPRPGGGPITFDPKTQALLPVDDRIVPEPARVAELDTLVGEIEAAGTSGTSFLQGLLSRATGQTVVNGPQAGDLYFYPVARTEFDVTDPHALLFLAADADLSAVQSIAPADMGLESAGNIRGVLKKGKTGVLSAADVFNVLPLGASPVDGTVGYPLVRAYLPVVVLRTLFEAASSLGAIDGDYDLVPAGVRVEYDCTRPPIRKLPDDLGDPSKGRVNRILLDTDHANGFEDYDQVIWDRTSPPADAGPLYAVVTSSYIAQFAGDIGATLLDSQGNPLALADAIVKRQDLSEVKEIEALMSYLHTASSMPAMYDPFSPNRTPRFASFAACH